MRFKVVALLGLFVAVLWIFFSYRLTSVPPGINIDEANIGYDAAFLAENLHDSDGRLTPVFTLAMDNHDWHQPVTVYATATAFKLFNRSFYTLRAVSIIFLIVSTLLLILFLSFNKDKILMLFGLFFFLTTPLLMIQSHLALENIAPLPFAMLWLILLQLYSKERKLSLVALAGIIIGISFYSYKGMRLIVPIWGILSIGYLYLQPGSFAKRIKAIASFSLAAAPFLLITPILEIKYAGAVFDKQTPHLKSYHDLLYPYLSSFDLSFLFFKGDSTLYHSTGRHGALLLGSLPFFVVGAFQAIKKKGILLFILLCFLLTPALFGLADSVHRASRLVVLIPFFTILCAQGAMTILRFKMWNMKYLIISFLMLFALYNYYDFVAFYWNSYPELVRDSFTNTEPSFRLFANEVQKRNLTAVIQTELYINKPEAKYFEKAYLKQPALIWNTQDPLPPKSLILSNLEKIKGATRVDIPLPLYYLHQTP
jgi:hypothetical protein